MNKVPNRSAATGAPPARRRLTLARGAFVVALGVACAASASALVHGRALAPRAGEVRAAGRSIGAAAGDDDRAADLPPDVAAGDGIVEPADRETKVAAAVAGRIAAIVVHEGDHVDAGAPLVRLEDGPERAALALAAADLAAARADLAKTDHGQRREDIEATVGDAEAAETRAVLSADVFARTQALAPGGATTPDELEKARRQAEGDRHTADAAAARRRAAVAGSRVEDVFAARARVAAAVAKRDQAAAYLDRLVVRAPLGGEILQIKYRAGEYETPGGQDPLVVMGDTKTLRVRLDIDERDIGKVSRNAAAFVRADAYSGRRFPGRVIEVARRMGRKNVRTDDPTERIDTKILEVVLELDEAVGLVPGQRVSAYVTASNAPPRPPAAAAPLVP